MNIAGITNVVTRFGGRTLLHTQKYAPQILTGIGILSGITSTVLASKATLKLPQLVDDTAVYIEVAKESKEKTLLSDKEYAKEVGFVYGRTGLALAKLYGPAVSFGALSVVCIVSAQGIMQQRNAALTAAYVAVEKALVEYRKRVETELGPEKERQLYYNTKTEDIYNPSDGTVVKVEVPVDPNKYSVYARFFDEYNPNWEKIPEYNFIFLKHQQNYFNDLLVSRGHVFLNEVYDALGIPHSSAGSIVGWVYNGKGDDFIDFGIFNGDREVVRCFVNGQETSILLDFNVDGPIWNLI